jgi:hypothetical protein
VLAEKGMLERIGELPQHWLRVAAVHRIEQPSDPLAHDRMIHDRLP